MKQFEEKTAISYFVSNINAKNVQMNGNRRKIAKEYKGDASPCYLDVYKNIKYYKS